MFYVIFGVSLTYIINNSKGRFPYKTLEILDILLLMMEAGYYHPNSYNFMEHNIHI